MTTYRDKPEIAVTRRALDASTEAGRQVVVLIAELAKAQAEVAALLARYEALAERLRDD